MVMVIVIVMVTVQIGGDDGDGVVMGGSDGYSGDGDDCGWVMSDGS